jgi:hypothetical protein
MYDEARRAEARGVLDGGGHHVVRLESDHVRLVGQLGYVLQEALGELTPRTPVAVLLAARRAACVNLGGVQLVDVQGHGQRHGGGTALDHVRDAVGVRELEVAIDAAHRRQRVSERLGAALSRLAHTGERRMRVCSACAARVQSLA